MRHFMLVLSLLLIGLLPLQAQSDEIFAFDNGVQLTYPSDASVRASRANDNVVFVMFEGDQTIQIANNEFVGEESGLGLSATGDDILLWWMDFLFEGGVDVDPSEFLSLIVGDYEGVTVAYRTEDGQIGSAMILYLHNIDSDDQWIALNGLGDSFGIGALVLSVADSVHPTAIRVVKTQSNNTPRSVACTIRTSDTDTVQLRVGPGTNRGVYAFLPANVNFTPLGQATADDGSMWFQLDREKVAPNSAAAEAWVAAEAVDTTGDCTAIGESDAPPIVPIVQQPPNTGGASDPPAASGGSIPNSGIWHFTSNSYSDASCIGYDNFRFNEEVQSFDTYIRVQGGGSSFLNQDENHSDLYVRTAPGQYQGSFTWDDGTNSQLYLTVVSSRYMVGSMIYNFTLDGLQCSATVGVTLTQ